MQRPNTGRLAGAVVTGLIVLSLARYFLFPPPIKTTGEWEVLLGLDDNGIPTFQIHQPTVIGARKSRRFALINREPPFYSWSTQPLQTGEGILIRLLNESDARASSIRAELNNDASELIVTATLSMPTRIVFEPGPILAVFHEPSGLQIEHLTLHQPGFIDLRATLAPKP